MTIAEFENWLTERPFLTAGPSLAARPAPASAKAATISLSPNAGRSRRVLVMGVLNVTPDSFSDGGRFAEPAAAVAHGLEMIAEGADLLDIGAESTRPGSARVSAEEQIGRAVPVIKQLVARSPTVLSIDTTRCPVARAALDAGALIVNDISAGRDDEQMFDLVAARRVPMILMHMQGEPATMQNNPTYRDVVREVGQFLRQRMDAAVARGIGPSRLILDPGIGFGKKAEHSLELLRRIPELAEIGRPLLIGTSRKKFLGVITGETEPAERHFATAASVAWSVAQGASIVRVHDVGAMKKVVNVIRAIQTGSIS